MHKISSFRELQAFMNYSVENCLILFTYQADLLPYIRRNQMKISKSLAILSDLASKNISCVTLIQNFV